MVAAVLALASCSSTESGNDKTVTLVSHESFNISDTVLKQFESESGLTVKVLRSGDAGSAVNQAILTKDNPQGDVFFGVDNTFLSRALDAGLFTTYEAADAGKIPQQYKLDSENRVTPIDYGDVCVNYDKKYFADKKLAVPTTFADLAKPEYKNLLVVENPATSSPGLAFLLGSIAQFGVDGWQQYWTELKNNGVLVVDGWEEAYTSRFSGPAQSKGDRPLVVSYASSPPYESASAATPGQEPPTGNLPDTCFRQIEFAGLLANAKNSDGGKKLIDFLISKPFQEDVPNQMAVYPVREDAELPEVFVKYTDAPDQPKSLPADQIAKNREDWIKAWTSTVLK